MNTATLQRASYPVSHYRNQEQRAFSSIPGMKELANARSEVEHNNLSVQHPEAAFAQMILSNLFCHDRELNVIYLKAYKAILNGDPIADIRFRFDKELDTHWENHLWDD